MMFQARTLLLSHLFILVMLIQSLDTSLRQVSSKDLNISPLWRSKKDQVLNDLPYAFNIDVITLHVPYIIQASRTRNFLLITRFHSSAQHF